MFRKYVLAMCLCLCLMAEIAAPALAGGTTTSRQTRAVGEKFSLSVSGNLTGDYRWQCDGTVIRIVSGNDNVCSVQAVRAGKGWIYCSYNVYGRMPGVINGPITVIDAFTERWEIEVTGEPCTVTFDRQDGSVPEQVKAFTQAAAVRPEDPVRPGFVLDGWYTDPACTLSYDFKTLLTGDLTLYARWRAARTVTFRSRGEEASVQTVADGHTAAPPKLPAFRGYVLEGWYTDQKFTAAYRFDAPVTSDLTLYARWEPAEELTVTFDCGNGQSALTVFSGEAVPQPAEPRRVGWSFQGWYSDPACTQRWAFATPLTEDRVLYAGWKKDPEPERPEEPEKPQTCTVRFDSRGGSEVSEQTVVLGDRLEEPKAPEREGYTFDGWFADAACTEPWHFPFDVYADRYLYAGWTVNQYTVTFIEEQTWFGLPEPKVLYVQTVDYGDCVEEPPPAGGKGLFCGWVEGMRLSYWEKESGLFDFSQPVTGDITLTAVWITPPEPMDGALETNPDIRWELGEDGVLTLSGTGGTGDWDEEDEDGYLVFNQPWREYWSQILSIEVQPGIDSIGPYTFYGCDRTVQVSLPEGLERIGNDAFSGCCALTEIQIPNSVRELGKDAFRECRSLRSANLPEDLTELPDRCFYHCMRLREAPLPDCLTKIGKSALEDCTALKSLGLPDSLREMGSSAFEGCTGLQELILPEGLTDSGSNTFKGCTGLRRIQLPGTLKTAGYQSFYGCTGLEEVLLPAGVESINSTFWKCAGLKRVVLPASVKSIRSFSFSLGENWTGPLDVFYGGTKEQWEAVSISDTENDALLSGARVHCGCTEISPLFSASFDAQGGSAVGEQICAQGGFLTEPIAPELAHYELDGWFLDPDCTRRWEFGTDRVQGDLKLYAGWRPCQYTVTFTGAGTRTVEYGAQAVPPQAPVRLGYRFDGWYTDEAAERLYLFSSAVTEDLILYPGWLETLEGPVDTKDLRVKKWGNRPGQTFIDFSDPAGVLDRDVAVYAAVYETGRMERILSGRAGDGSVVFDAVLGDGTRVFLMDAKTCIPLCIRLLLQE